MSNQATVDAGDRILAVAAYDRLTGLPAMGSKGDTGGGPAIPAATTSSSRAAQNTISQGDITLVSDVGQTIVPANAATTGCRLLNYTAAIVYLTDGTTGDPVYGSPSDFIPAGTATNPGQYECAYQPILGLRARGNVAGKVAYRIW